MFFVRPLVLLRSISLSKSSPWRLFSLSRVSRSAADEKQLLPVDRQLPAISRLPSYLPAPTGVPSKLFDQFFLIYRLGFHQPLRFIQMIKVAQALATALLTPYRIYTYNEGLITLSELGVSLFLLSLATASLCAFGWVATRAVCFIYTTVECDRVILSQIDFWGRRRNVELPTRDIVPINDIETPNRTILPFKRYSTEETIYYSTRVGQILDRPRFNRIFAGLITEDEKTWW